jgi:hypothetical protein
MRIRKFIYQYNVNLIDYMHTNTHIHISTYYIHAKMHINIRIYSFIFIYT